MHLVLRRLLPVTLLALAVGHAPLRAEDAPKPPGGAPAATAAKVTLVDAGAEPRQPLRWKVAAPKKERATFTTRISMSGSPIELPTMTMGVLYDIDRVDADGSAHTLVRFESMTASEIEGGPPAVAEAMKAVGEQMKRAEMRMVTTSRGQLKDFTTTLGADLDPSLRGLLEDSLRGVREMSAASLPEEAVGVGARWTVESTVQQSGMTLKQTGTFKLLRSEGTRHELELAIAQRADAQPLEVPGMPAGVDVQLERLESKGTMTLLLDLAQLVPVDGRMRLEMDQTIRIGSEGGSQEMEQQIEVEMTFKGEPAK